MKAFMLFNLVTSISFFFNHKPQSSYSTSFEFKGLFIKWF